MRSGSWFIVSLTVLLVTAGFAAGLYLRPAVDSPQDFRPEVIIQAPQTASHPPLNQVLDQAKQPAHVAVLTLDQIPKTTWIAGFTLTEDGAALEVRFAGIPGKYRLSSAEFYERDQIAGRHFAENKLCGELPPSWK